MMLIVRPARGFAQCGQSQGQGGQGAPGQLNAAGTGTGLEGEILDQGSAIGEVVEGDVVLEPIVDGNQLTGLRPIELGTDNVIEDLEAAQEKKLAEEGRPKGNHQDGSRCCPNGSYNAGGKCCPNGTRNESGRCCRPGSYNAGGRICPVGTVNPNGRRTPAWR
jgi:hypothetical protein